MLTENKSQLIPLNIVMTYPVQWGKYQILRDFVQNFYDSVGYKNWQNSFYYPKNEIMGKVIWEGEEGAVYHWNKHEIDKGLPKTRQFERKGAVFCGFQMLGTNPFGLIVCLHKCKKEDRERRGLYDFEVVNIFESIIYYIDASGAMAMLEKMKRYWNSYPQKNIDIHSWSGVIDSLIYKIGSSPDIKEAFVKKYNNLLCLPRIYHIREKNRRGQARTWLSRQERKYTLVKGTFMRLGYQTLENECELHGGFIVDDSVSKPHEVACFQLLEDICREIFDGYFVLKQWPEHKIIVNERASYHGMATVYKRKQTILNNYGLSIRYNIEKIYLKHTIFKQGGYYDGLSTYVHELCHMFGGDSSVSFSLALTYAMELLMKNPVIVRCGNEKWCRIFEENEVLEITEKGECGCG